MAAQGLGRREPTDWTHVERHPARLAAVTTDVNRLLSVPPYRVAYDQGAEGACVGFSLTWMMSILNRRRYEPRWLYHQAQLGDEWDDTPPMEGTSVRAGCDVLRTAGHRRVYRGSVLSPVQSEGILSNQWATGAEDVRLALGHGIPVVLGINWYAAFEPVRGPGGRWWIAREESWGPVVGGHAICVTGWSDAYDAAALTNTWGYSWPLRVYLPRPALERLLSEAGEGALVVDR